MSESKQDIGNEMARRKIMFHLNESWESIRLWGLFYWDDVSAHLKSGDLRTAMVKANRVIWVWPSAEFYHKYIEPQEAKWKGGV